MYLACTKVERITVTYTCFIQIMHVTVKVVCKFSEGGREGDYTMVVRVCPQTKICRCCVKTLERLCTTPSDIE